jgi:hypothetical protein
MLLDTFGKREIRKGLIDNGRAAVIRLKVSDIEQIHFGSGCSV